MTTIKSDNSNVSGNPANTDEGNGVEGEEAEDEDGEVEEEGKEESRQCAMGFSPAMALIVNPNEQPQAYSAWMDGGTSMLY